MAGFPATRARAGGPTWLHGLGRRAASLDGIERFAALLFLTGAALLLWGTLLDPPGSLPGAVAEHHQDWAPGLLTDAVLLWVVNAILRRHERRRIVAQVGSLSREFALDAVRRAREEGWLLDGTLRWRTLARASLAGADLSDGVLTGADLSFADLRGATLTHADLRDVDLTGADLTDADLRWSSLRGACLHWADLRGALLEGTDLERVDARWASVEERHGQDEALAGAVVGGFLDDGELHEVRRTFDLLLARGTGPVEAFYRRLFESSPELRPLFRSEPRRQARKFLQSLKVIVSALHTPVRHLAILRRLGERHDGYGVQPEHYAVVGGTLLAVLQDELGPELTPAARAGWERAFHLMAAVMQDGAETARTQGGPAAVPAGAPSAAGEAA